MTTDMQRTGSVRRLHIMALILGIWFVVAPFVLNYAHTAATANEIVLGILIAFFSFVRLRSPVDTWTSWLNAAAGLWAVFSPFIFGYSHQATYWNQLLLGIALIIMMVSALGATIRHHSHLAH